MKNNKGFTPIAIIIVIIALLAVGGGAYYAGTHRQIEKNSANNISAVPAESKIEGNKDDLISFSVSSGDAVSGVLNFSGTVKGAYFFEGNIGVAILDGNKKLLKQGHGDSTSDWMTTGPVSFAGAIDLTGLPPGPGYIEISNDNPSDRRDLDKFIYIPIIISKPIQ